MGISLKHWLSSSGSRSGPRFCISNKCLSEVDAIGLLTTLRSAGVWNGFSTPGSLSQVIHPILTQPLSSPYSFSSTRPFPGFPAAPPMKALTHLSTVSHTTHRKERLFSRAHILEQPLVCLCAHTCNRDSEEQKGQLPYHFNCTFKITLQVKVEENIKLPLYCTSHHRNMIVGLF